MLIDGGHLIKRIAYTEQGSLVSSKGFPSGLAHGFLGSLIALSKRYRGSKAYVAFDWGKSKYRTEIYSDYKCKREDLLSEEYTGPDIISAKTYIIFILRLLGIPVFMCEGMEADDIIAALSFQFPKNSVIVSSDQDFFQLVTDGVVLFDPIRKIVYDIDRIVGDTYDKANWVDQYVLHKCIIGDKDEVPQIHKGLGYKRALPLVKCLSYGCLLPEDNKYTVDIMSNLDLLDRNIQLFDLRESFRVLKDELRDCLQSFCPTKFRGLELEHNVRIVLDKWELEEISYNIFPLVSLSLLEPIKLNF